jgi:hypothetical protein
VAVKRREVVKRAVVKREVVKGEVVIYSRLLLLSLLLLFTSAAHSLYMRSPVAALLQLCCSLH